MKVRLWSEQAQDYRDYDSEREALEDIAGLFGFRVIDLEWETEKT